MWQMILCLGITWAGCGAHHTAIYPNEASCYRALKAVQENSQPISESNKKRSMVAYCAPLKVK